MRQDSDRLMQNTATSQRVRGHARLSFRRNAQGATVLGDLYQQAPCRVLFPQVEADEPIQAVLLTTSGGLTSGDQIRVDAAVAAGARATLTTQAAEKLYRGIDGEADTRIDYHLQAAAGGWLECLAQETILFDHARLRRRFTVDAEAGSSVLAVESLVFGRTAMNERFRHGRLHDGWRVYREGRLIWADAWHLDGDVEALRTAAFGLGEHLASATLIYLDDAAPALLPVLRQQLQAQAGEGAEGGATAFEHLLLLRLLDPDAARLRRRLMALLLLLRSAAADLPARLPRVWTC